MLRAMKGNRVVRIPDEKRKHYEAMGYRITDMEGNLVYEPVDAEKENMLLKERVAALDAENAQLKGQLDECAGRILALDAENAQLKGERETAQGAADAPGHGEGEKHAGAPKKASKTAQQ